MGCPGTDGPVSPQGNLGFGDFVSGDLDCVAADDEIGVLGMTKDFQFFGIGRRASCAEDRAAEVEAGEPFSALLRGFDDVSGDFQAADVVYENAVHGGADDMVTGDFNVPHLFEAVKGRRIKETAAKCTADVYRS